MKKRRFFVNSTIAKRISKKMFLIYISIYLFILITLLLILTPALYNIAVKNAAYNLSVVTDEYRMMQNSMEKSLNNLYLDTDLSSYQSIYYLDPTVSNKEKVNIALSKVASRNDDTLAFCLEDRKGNFFASLSYSSIDKKKYLHMNEEYNKLLQFRYSSYFSPVIENQFHYEQSTYDCFAYSKNIVFASVPMTATVFYNATSTMKHCCELLRTTFSYFAVFDQYHSVLYQSDASNTYATCLEKFSKVKTISGKIRDKEGLFFYQTMPSTNTTILAYTTFQQLMATPTFFIGIITLLYLLSPVLYMFFLTPVIQQQLAPLKKLSDAMSEYSVGSEIHMTIQTNDEIEIVSNSFNQMISQINNQIGEIKKKEHENAVINYKLLATQIDPHFIYNTMNIVNIMAQEGNIEAVIEINSALIKILRERLNTKLSIFDSIKNEINTIMQYCLIMSYRYQNNIAVSFNVDESLENDMIPKNILQPLVENSFLHGFSGDNPVSNGSVGILIYSIDNEIIIEVSDSGRGMPQERINELLQNSYSIYADKKPHIGINNVRQRLNYLYHGHYKFDIQSAIGQGTTVSITIPLEGC